jgi:hypothetical protein
LRVIEGRTSTAKPMMNLRESMADACLVVRPSRKLELTATPGALSASSPIGSDASSGLAATTRRIGRSYFVANSKSR